jgi:hypothetical protein
MQGGRSPSSLACSVRAPMSTTSGTNFRRGTAPRQGHLPCESRAVFVLLSSSDVIDTRFGQTFGAVLRPDKVISPAQRVARRFCVSSSSAAFLCLFLLLLSSSDVIDTRLGQTFGAALRPDKVISPAQRIPRRSCVSSSAPFLCLFLLLLLSSSDVIDTDLGQTFAAALRPDKVISPSQRVARRSCVSSSFFVRRHRHTSSTHVTITMSERGHVHVLMCHVQTTTFMFMCPCVTGDVVYTMSEHGHVHVPMCHVQTYYHLHVHVPMCHG